MNKRLFLSLATLPLLGAAGQAEAGQTAGPAEYYSLPGR